MTFPLICTFNFKTRKDIWRTIELSECIALRTHHPEVEGKTRGPHVFGDEVSGTVCEIYMAEAAIEG